MNNVSIISFFQLINEFSIILYSLKNIHLYSLDEKIKYFIYIRDLSIKNITLEDNDSIKICLQNIYNITNNILTMLHLNNFDEQTFLKIIFENLTCVLEKIKEKYKDILEIKFYDDHLLHYIIDIKSQTGIIFDNKNNLIYNGIINNNKLLL